MSLVIDRPFTDEEIKLLSQGLSPMFVVPDHIIKWAPLISVSPGCTAVISSFESEEEE